MYLPKRIGFAAASLAVLLMIPVAPVATAPPAGAGTFPGGNGVIAFASVGERGADIFTVCPDGSRLQRLIRTPHQQASVYSDWSPDGSTLAFDSDRSGNVEIYVQGPQGRPRRLTRNAGDDTHPTWSPNGRRVAFESTRAGAKQVFTLGRHGGRARQVTHFGPGAEEPAWSPSGKWIAFLSGPVRRTALYVVHPDGTGLRQLTRRSLNAGHPSWSPDGTTIVFNTHFERPNGRIWTVDLRGRTTRVTSPPQGTEDFEPAFSPDGRYVAFTRFTKKDGSDADIWVVGADGSGARNITPGSAGFDVGAAWSVATPQACPASPVP